MILILLEAQLKAPKTTRPTTWKTKAKLAIGGIALVPAFVALAVTMSPLAVAIGASALLGIGAFVSATDEA